MNESTPLACTLDAANLRTRTGWIADLNTRWLLTKRSQDLALELDYAGEALPELKELVAAERSCCAFLRFDLAEHPQFVRLTIEAPEQAGENVGALFEPFLAGSGPDVGETPCGCSSTESPALTESGSTGSVAGAAAAAASTAALACGVCCVLPLILPAAITAMFGGVFAWFEGAYGWMPVGVLAVAAAWLWVLRESALTHRRPANATLALMSVATVSAVLALQWPRIEDPLRRLLVG